ncbi:MAG: hypothetical protein ACRCS0_04245 [Albidovulum sp.]
MIGGKRHYCSGFWSVSGNLKYPAGHYSALLPKTLDMIAGGSLTFFGEDRETREKVQELCAGRDIAVDLVDLPLVDLPAWDLADRMVAACAAMRLDRFSRPAAMHAEKGVVHYWRDLTGSGAAAYRAMLAIWLSKVALAASVSRQQSGGVQTVWIDASIARINGMRENYDFTKAGMPAGRLCHYGSEMRYLGGPLPLSAGVMAADATTWPRIEVLFHDCAESAAGMAYGHDEETILSECVRREPAMFHCLGQPLPFNPRARKRGLAKRIAAVFRRRPA